MVTICDLQLYWLNVILKIVFDKNLKYTHCYYHLITAFCFNMN